MSKKKRTLETAKDLQDYMTTILVRLEKDEIDLAKARELSNIIYKLNMIKHTSLKEEELAQAKRLEQQLQQLQSKY